MCADFAYGNLPPYEGRCMMWDDEREAVLSRMGERCRLMEIGTKDGITAAWLAERRPKAVIVSVDPFVAGPPLAGVAQCAGSIEKWRKNSHRNQMLFMGTAQHYATEFPPERFDIVVVDGDHGFDACTLDISTALALLADGGVIAAHDYGRGPGKPELQGVTDAVDACIEAGSVVKLDLVRSLVFLGRAA